jgi:triphosphoribosyl-dephospho-CoA synthetase
MYQATGGINTHKGTIFSIGLFCAAAGRLSPEHWTPENLCMECAAMTEGIVAADFAGITAENAKTVGEQLYAAYGITGVRGQAEAGFPAVLNAGLPVLRQGLSEGLSLNDAGCAALLHLLSVTDDTNLIHRSDRETQLQVRSQVAAILKETPYPSQEVLTRLDQQFIGKNLSPGGSADLLAVTYFLHFLTA